MKQFVACREILGDENFGDEVWVNLDYVQTVYPYTSCPRSEDFGRSSFGDVIEDRDGVQYVCGKYEHYEEDGEPIDELEGFERCILTFGEQDRNNLKTMKRHEKRMTNRERFDKYFSAYDGCEISVQADEPVLITLQTKRSNPERMYTMCLEDWLNEDYPEMR